MVGRPYPSGPRREVSGLISIGSKKEGKELRQKLTRGELKGLKNQRGSFEQLVHELEEMKNQYGYLRHDERTVSLLSMANVLTVGDAYPHPRIASLFGVEKLVLASENVASWSGSGNLGVKTKKGVTIQEREIIGVYGGRITSKVGLYVMDVSANGIKRWVDAVLDDAEISLFGRINEDIHYGVVNVVVDVTGIIYACERISGDVELLMSYGSAYNWGHVVQIGLDALKIDLGHMFPDFSIPLPDTISELRNVNPLQAWVKKLVWGEAQADEVHSTEDKQLQGIDRVISYLSSATALHKYGFRRCGMAQLDVKVIDSDKLGRKFVNHCSREVYGEIALVPFREVWKRNIRISTLRMMILNGNHVDEVNLHAQRQSREPPPLGTQLGPALPVAELVGRNERESRLISDIIQLFPFTADWIGQLTSVTIRLGHDPLRMAIADILDGRLGAAQLHSCHMGRDWRGFEGLAAFLRSGELYTKYNGDINASPAIGGIKRNAEFFLSEWRGGYKVRTSLSRLISCSPSCKRLATSLLNRMGDHSLREIVTGDESIMVTKGRISVSLNLGNGMEKERRIYELNSCICRAHPDSLSSAPIWSIKIRYNGKEPQLPNDGYDGYRILDLAFRCLKAPVSTTNMEDRKHIAFSIRGAAMECSEAPRPEWGKIPRNKMNHAERALKVAQLMEGESGKPLPWRLHKSDWMSTSIMKGICRTKGSSLWDTGDTNEMTPLATHLNTAGPLSADEWMAVMGKTKVAVKNQRFHVIGDEIALQTREAMEEALETLKDLIRDQTSIITGDLRPGLSSAASLLANTPLGLNFENPMVVDAILESIPENDSLPSLALFEETISAGDIYGDVPLAEEITKDICVAIGSPLKLLREEGDLVHNSRGVGRIITRERDGSCKIGKPAPVGMDNLRVLFWNSNGWDAEKAQRISRLSQDEGSNIICIVDARIKSTEMGQKLSSLTFHLECKTGIKWKGKVFPMLEGCQAGGALIMVSDRCSGVVYPDAVAGGLLSTVSLKWGNKRVTVAAIYRPVAGEGGVHSLRRVASKQLGDDIDDVIVSLMTKLSGNTELMIGGDFNLDALSTERFLNKAGIRRSICALDEDVPSFRRKAGISVQESNIDHIVWTGKCISGASVVTSGDFVTDHIPMVGWVERKAPPDTSTRVKFCWSPSISSYDEKSIEVYKNELEERLADIDLSSMSICDITQMAVGTSRKIGEKRRKGKRSDGWSPLSRLLELEAITLGTGMKLFSKARYNEIVPRKLRQAVRDSKRIRLNADEVQWLRDNHRDPPITWTEWKLVYPTRIHLLDAYMDIKNKLSDQRRRELRLLHGGRMRRIQEAADEGRIGSVLKSIVGRKPPFSLECVRDGERNVTDAEEITKLVTEFFRQWFARTTGEAWRDHAISDAIICGDRDRFMELSTSLEVPQDVAAKVWDSCAKKELPNTGCEEMGGLDDYTPTYEEFLGFVKCSNPRSAGGFNGMSYLLLMHLPEQYLQRIYDCLVEAWNTRTPVDGWGDRWLVPIPKISDPSLKDLRPLMLVDVLRKVWVGLLMDRIRQLWNKWGLFDESQHGFMNGKGTETAVPHVIDLIETARDSCSSLYISSWDIVRAFDSLGRETVVMAMLRMHVPERLVNYITSQDKFGRVYVRTPLNYKRHMGSSISSLTSEDGFKTGKGVGQGDIPSPLLWAAAFDTLLCALKFLNSRFSILDLGYNKHIASDVCYADDLLSAEVSLVDLQNKADIVSGWCIIMGVKISHAKFRTFGMNWGTKNKITGKLIIHTEGWTEVLVDVRSEGVLTHLGVIWNTDYKNKELWNSISSRMEDLGWRIARSWARAGDRMMAMSYCLRQDICYRLQFASWPLAKYEELDKAYLRIMRRITKNMKGYPSLPMMMDTSRGGLGIETPMVHAQKCKLRIVMRGLEKGGSIARHIESLFRIELRKAGTGGLPNQHIALKVSFGESGFLTSLIEFLDEMGLGFGIQGMVYNSPLSTWVNFASNPSRRRKGWTGYKMLGEVDKFEYVGESIPLRAGQHWETRQGVMEIVSFNEAGGIGVRRWDGLGNRQMVGATLIRRPGDEAGAGPGLTLDGSKLKDVLGRLAVVTDCPQRVKSRAVTVDKLLNRIPAMSVPRCLFNEDWGSIKDEVFCFDRIYTDGSWEEECTLKDYLMGTRKVRSGGAVVLSDGLKHFPIFVEMDVETDSAYDSELISLLIAVLIAGDRKVQIFTDCESAMNVLQGGAKGHGLNFLSGWRTPPTCRFSKVKAHPERYKKIANWNSEDKGNWMADQVAGRMIRAARKVLASEWLARINNKSKITVITKEGKPFLGNVFKRWSEHLHTRYFRERDDYREERGKARMWEGSNMRHIHKVMGKGRGIADKAAVQRLALDKRWRWHWARDNLVCHACGKPGVCLIHPIRHCMEESIDGERKLLAFKAKMRIDEARKSFRPTLEELWRNMEAGQDGEYACCGLFTPAFVNNLTRADAPLHKEERSAVDRLLKGVGSGTRELLRKHGEIGMVGRVLSRSTQSSILPFLRKSAPGPERVTEGKKRRTSRAAYRPLTSCAPGRKKKSFLRGFSVFFTKIQDHRKFAALQQKNSKMEGKKPLGNSGDNDTKDSVFGNKMDTSEISTTRSLDKWIKPLGKGKKVTIHEEKLSASVLMEPAGSKDQDGTGPVKPELNLAGIETDSETKVITGKNSDEAAYLSPNLNTGNNNKESLTLVDSISPPKVLTSPDMQDEVNVYPHDLETRLRVNLSNDLSNQFDEYMEDHPLSTLKRQGAIDATRGLLARAELIDPKTGLPTVPLTSRKRAGRSGSNSAEASRSSSGSTPPLCNPIGSNACTDDRTDALKTMGNSGSHTKAPTTEDSSPSPLIISPDSDLMGGTGGRMGQTDLKAEPPAPISNLGAPDGVGAATRDLTDCAWRNSRTVADLRKDDRTKANRFMALDSSDASDTESSDGEAEETMGGDDRLAAAGFHKPLYPLAAPTPEGDKLVQLTLKPRSSRQVDELTMLSEKGIIYSANQGTYRVAIPWEGKIVMIGTYSRARDAINAFDWAILRLTGPSTTDKEQLDGLVPPGLDLNSIDAALREHGLTIHEGWETLVKSTMNPLEIRLEDDSTGEDIHLELQDIKCLKGRVLVSLDLGTHHLAYRKLRDIQERHDSGLADFDEMEIWRVSFSHNSSENKVEGKGYCGFLALDQILRGLERPVDLRNSEQRLELAKTIRKLVAWQREPPRDGWGDTDESGWNVSERALWVALALEDGNHPGILPLTKWFSSGLIADRLDEIGCSYWEYQGKRMEIMESHLDRGRGAGAPYKVSQWKSILVRHMLCFKDSHNYVRKNGLLESFHEALEGAKRKLEASIKNLRIKRMLDGKERKKTLLAPPCTGSSVPPLVHDLDQADVDLGDANSSVLSDPNRASNGSNAGQGSGRTAASWAVPLASLQVLDSDLNDDRSGSLVGALPSTGKQPPMVLDFRNLDIDQLLSLPPEVSQQLKGIRFTAPRLNVEYEEVDGLSGTALELAKGCTEDDEISTESDDGAEPWMAWDDGALHAGEAGAYELTNFSPMLAAVFHERTGFSKLWSPELELIRVIMEQEPPDGEDFRSALYGGFSYWRWREWVIFIGLESTFQTRGVLDAVLLMGNMAGFNLPESFTQTPSPLSSTVGDALLKRAWTDFKLELVMENEVSESESESESNPPLQGLTSNAIPMHISPASPSRRTSLHLSSPTKLRTFDQKLEFVTAGTNGEGVFKVEVTFDTGSELSHDPLIRLDEMKRAARIRISMWKRRVGKLIMKPKSVDLALEAGSDGFHEMGQERSLSVAQLVVLAKRTDIVVVVKEDIGRVAYMIGTAPLRKLMSRLVDKLQNMSNEMESWVIDNVTPCDLDFLGCSLDSVFQSSHVLIGNIPQDTIRGPASSETVNKILRAICMASPGARLTQDSIRKLSGLSKFHITPSDLGAKGFYGNKVSIVVDIETPVDVGLNMNGGIPILARLPVDPVLGNRGEFFLRQFLTEGEASYLTGLEKVRLLSPGENRIAFFRLTNTYSGMDDVARRCIMESLSKLLGVQVHCFPISGKHKWDGSGELKEETVLVATSAFVGGDQLLYDVLDIARDTPVFSMSFGSLEVQGHLSMDSIVNKPLFEADQLLHIRRVKVEKDMDLIAVQMRMKEFGKIVVVMPETNSSPGPYSPWTVVLEKSRSPEITAGELCDKAPTYRTQWPGRHAIIKWSGDRVRKEASIVFNEPDRGLSPESPPGFKQTKERKSKRRKSDDSSHDLGSEGTPRASQESISTGRSTISSLTGTTGSSSHRKDQRTDQNDRIVPLPQTSNDVNASPITAAGNKSPPTVSPGSHKVMIRNIGFDVTEADLRRTMAKAGKLVKVGLYIQDGRSLGRGFAEYTTHKEADTAVSQLNDKEIKKRPIHVTKFRDNKRKLTSPMRGAPTESAAESTSTLTPPEGPRLNPNDSSSSDSGRPPPSLALQTPLQTPKTILKRPTVTKSANSSPSTSSSSPSMDSETDFPPLSLAFSSNMSADTTKIPHNTVRQTKTFGLGLKEASNFRTSFKGKGLKYVMVPGDGWCLFHAVALGLGRPDQGLKVMEEVILEMITNAPIYSGSVIGSLESHIASLRRFGWGDHTEIHAISRIYNRKIEMWQPGTAGSPIPREPYIPSPGALKLAYYPGSHYDALLPADGLALAQPSPSSTGSGTPSPTMGRSPSTLTTMTDRSGTISRSGSDISNSSNHTNKGSHIGSSSNVLGKNGGWTATGNGW